MAKYQSESEDDEYIEQEEISSDSQESEEMNWGNKNKDYYQEDGKSVSDDENLEEEEAMKLYKNNAQNLQTEFFQTQNKDAQSSDEDVDLIKKYRNVSKKDRLEIIKNKYPQHLQILEEYKEYAKELNKEYYPHLYKIKQQPQNEIQKLLETKYMVLNEYCQNLVFYILVVIENQEIKVHPVLKKILSLKNYLKQINKLIYDNKLEIQEFLKKPYKKHIQQQDISEEEEEQVQISQNKQIDQIKLQKQRNKNIMKSLRQQDFKVQIKQKNDYNQIMNQINQNDKNEEIENILQEQQDLFSDEDDLSMSSQNDLPKEDQFYKSMKSKKIKKRKETNKAKKQHIQQQLDNMEFKEVQEDDSRKINRQILKNRGLIKRRKKIDRNSRVKNRVKFGKKIQKQKSTGVGLSRKDQAAYTGEVFIKQGHLKGTKLK